MSLRQIKKVLETQKKAKEDAEGIEEDAEEEEEEDEVPAPRTKKVTNAFALV